MDYYIVDRFEGDFALCETPGGMMEKLRRDLLPPETMEGDLLCFRSGMWIVDKAATQARREDMAKKRAALKKKQKGN